MRQRGVSSVCLECCFSVAGLWRECINQTFKTALTRIQSTTTVVIIIALLLNTVVSSSALQILNWHQSSLDGLDYIGLYESDWI